MIVLGAVAGWFIGSLLNWAAGFLPRYAANRSATPIKPDVPSKPALLQLLAALAARRDAARLPRSLWLNLGVELLTAMLFAWLWSHALAVFNLLLLSLVCSFLILVAVIDLRYRLVLNVLVLPAALLTVLARYATPGTNMLTVFLGGAFGFAIFAMVALLRPGELGGGDVKLATLIGLAFGFPDALWALMTGVLAGGIVAVLMLLSHQSDSKSQIPYAPFLCLGALIALFYNPISLVLYTLTGH